MSQQMKELDKAANGQRLKLLGFKQGLSQMYILYDLKSDQLSHM
jgi:hypothetical protein